MKSRVLEVARQFSESSKLLVYLRGTNVGAARTSELAIEAVAQHCESASCTRLAVKNVEGLARRFTNTRKEGDFTPHRGEFGGPNSRLP